MAEKKSEHIEKSLSNLAATTKTKRASDEAQKMYKWKNSMDDDWFMKVHHTIRNPSKKKSQQAARINRKKRNEKEGDEFPEVFALDEHCLK